jgi:hypothetical protein
VTNGGVNYAFRGARAVVIPYQKVVVHPRQWKMPANAKEKWWYVAITKGAEAAQAKITHVPLIVRHEVQHGLAEEGLQLRRQLEKAYG